MTITIITGDCREKLRELPDNSVHCCVSSPPYFGLRCYGHPDQMGLEPTPDEFVAGMVAVFREVRRVLRDDGTLWLNIGDSYGTGGSGQNFSAEHGSTANSTTTLGGYGHAPQKPVRGFHKQLLGVPWRLAFALQADGWYLRQDIIWSKPNPMPESVRDRCTKAHEYVFLLSKGPRYYYDAEAISEGLADASVARLSQDVEAQAGSERVPGKTNGQMKAVRKRKEGEPTRHGLAGVAAFGITELAPRGTRNKRSVWEVATQPFSEAHFATYPPALIEPCIAAGCPLSACAKCGAPWSPIWSRNADQPVIEDSDIDRYGDGSAGVHRKIGGQYQKWLDANPKNLKGSAPSCHCDAPSVPGTVLDPFFGAGTTGLVADRLQRNCIGIELNPEYAAIARKRLAQDGGMFAEVLAA